MKAQIECEICGHDFDRIITKRQLLGAIFGFDAGKSFPRFCSGKCINKARQLKIISSGRKRRIPIDGKLLCSKCKKWKSINEFWKSESRNKYLSHCKECAAIKQREQRARRQQIWQRYKTKHGDRIRKQQREYIRKPESLERRRIKRRSPREKINNAISVGMRIALKGRKKGFKWEPLVGYTLDDLMKHLEKQFTEKMTWENYGTYWEIDHIIPISAFNFSDVNHIDLRKCWALSNLRPLTCKENRAKNARLSKAFQPSLSLEVSI